MPLSVQKKGNFVLCCGNLKKAFVNAEMCCSIKAIWNSELQWWREQVMTCTCLCRCGLTVLDRKLYSYTSIRFPQLI